MTLYILVCGDKGRYDRPIDLDIIDTFTSLQQASLKLQQYIYQDPLMQSAIEQQLKSVTIDDTNYYLDYTDNYLTYYSTGCPSDNEYDGETCKIFKITI